MMGSDGTSSARLLGRIADEGDAAVLATSALTVSGALRDPEAGVLATTMRGAYHRMREAEGDTPSPVLPTYAGLQGPGGFDVVVVDGVAAPLGAVVFLHGFGGSFALPCWELAQAAREAGLVTYCPSVGWRGDWWTADGEATLRRTVDLVHARRLDRVYLAGLSNGGIGASRLAPRLRGAFKGLILISGAAPDAAPPGVPVLVVQGRRDEMCPAAMGRAYAARVGARYLEIEGGHFALLTHREGVTRAITGWLAQSARSR
jgi:pimeloyl-ACP methyl ester carboxylesterase